MGARVQHLRIRRALLVAALATVLATVLAMGAPVASAAAADGADGPVPRPPDRGAARRTMPAGVIQLDETVISGNQELPKILYIVPWQQPDGLPDIEIDTDFTEAELFRPLYPPAYRRELDYLEAGRANAASNTGDSKE